MPRPPKNRHPLREVRLATHFPSQRAFGDFLGVSGATVQAIEQGKMRLTPSLAARIRDLTGCDDAELLRGPQGKARTTTGEPYRAGHFEAWQNQLGKSLVSTRTGGVPDLGQLPNLLRMMLEAAQQRGGVSGVQAARGMLLEGLERIRQRMKLTDSLEAMLDPWQVAQQFSGSSAEWKSQRFPARKILGSGPLAPWPKLRRLTVGWQVRPAWAGGLTVVEKRAQNQEMFPPCYFVLGVGGAGARLAEQFWSGLAWEHGIDPQTGLALFGNPGGNWASFFRRVPQQVGADRYVPRAAFADLDPVGPQEIAARAADFFHSGAYFTGTGSAGNVFVGAQQSGVPELTSKTVEFIERLTDDLSGPASIILFQSIEGGTGSGLGAALLEMLKQRWPTLGVLAVAPLPEHEVSHVVVAPYNALLSLAALRRHGAATILISQTYPDNSAKSAAHTEEHFSRLNRQTAEALLALTAPIRFPAPLDPPLNLAEWLALCSDGPGVIGTPHILPLPHLAPRQKRLHLRLAEILAAAGKHFPAPVNDRAVVMLRVQEVERHEAKKRLDGMEIRLSSRAKPAEHDIVVALLLTAELRQALLALVDQAERLLGRQAFLHAYQQIGTTPESMRQCLDELRGALHVEAAASP